MFDFFIKRVRQVPNGGDRNRWITESRYLCQAKAEFLGAVTPSRHVVGKKLL